MKLLLITILIIATAFTGVVGADPGIPKVNEVQGLSTSTTVVAAGNFNSASSVDLTISARVPITDIPGPAWTQDPLTEWAQDGSIYESVYSEDTQNSDIGYISYDKDLDVSTANKASGQDNIQAVKQVTFIGIDASSVITNDYLMLDGAGWPGVTSERMICPFASPLDHSAYGAFCNRVETGSAMNLKVANLGTQLGDRFIMKSADPGVEIQNSVTVVSYTTGLPSKGSASAYIKGSVKEGGRTWADETGMFQDFIYPEYHLYETMTFSDSTSISGDISTFDKVMDYTSVVDTADDLPAVVGTGASG